MSVIDTIGDIIPNAMIETVILEQGKLTLYIYINEYIYKSGRGTWVTDENLTGMLNIHVRQSSIRSGRKTRKTVATKYASEPILSLDNIRSRREVTQKIMYKIVLEDFDYTGITDLSFMVTTQISKEDFQKSRQGTFKAADLRALRGRRSKVVVMRRGNVLSESLGFFLGDSFYTGPRTQLENGRWVTGRTRTASSKFLTTRTIPNIRVADYRDIDVARPRLCNQQFAL